MDLGQFRRQGAKLFEESWAAAPDYGLFVASLAAMQASSAAARAEAGGRRMRAANADDSRPLVDILLAAPTWRASVVAQGGCFHRIIAADRAREA
jgi:hypothetical protein